MSVAAQRADAMRQANMIKDGRGTVKRRIAASGRAAGGAAMADLMLASPASLRTTLVFQALQYVPKVGETGAIKMLRRCGVDSWVRVGRLTVRQREGLAECLRAHAEGREPVLPEAPRASVGVPLVAPEREPEVPVDTRRDVVPPRVKGPKCVVCGEHLRSVSSGRVCGFCRELADKVKEASR